MMGQSIGGMMVRKMIEDYEASQTHQLKPKTIPAEQFAQDILSHNGMITLSSKGTYHAEVAGQVIDGKMTIDSGIWQVIVNP